MKILIAALIVIEDAGDITADSSAENAYSKAVNKIPSPSDKAILC